MSMERIPKKRLEVFMKAAHRIAGHGLVVCSSGNLSWRIHKDRMLVTATRSWMADITAQQVALCRISDAESMNGIAPSKEVGFHAGILREREDVNVVLHFQSPCATTIACRKPQMEDFSVIPEIPYYIGPVGVVPYFNPGTRKLAEAVTMAIRKSNLAILQNHGQVVVGKDFDEVLEKAMYFELACRIILEAGKQTRFLPKKAVADLRNKLRNT